MKEERGYVTSFKSHEKSNYIHDDISTFTDKKLRVISLSCWLFSKPLISTSSRQNSPHKIVKIRKNWKMCDIILSHTKMAAIDGKSCHFLTISQKNRGP